MAVPKKWVRGEKNLPYTMKAMVETCKKPNKNRHYDCVNKKGDNRLTSLKIAIIVGSADDSVNKLQSEKS